MFRAPLLRRFLTVKVPRHGGTIEVQKVEVSKKQRLSTRKVIVQGLLLYFAYNTAKLAIYGPDPEIKRQVEEFQREVEQIKKEAEQQKRQGKETSEHSSDQDEAFSKAKALGQGSTAPDKSTSLPQQSEVIMFIPGWTKEVSNKLPYKHDSPEMKAFTAFKQDEKAVMKLYKMFDQAITREMKQSKNHMIALKYINYQGNVSRNLNIGAMLAQPTIYAIRCIVRKPNGDIALEWKPMKRDAGTRMQRFIYPVVMSKAFLAGVCAFTTTTFSLTRAKMMDLLFSANDTTIAIRYVKLEQWQFLHSISVAHSHSYEDRVIAKLPSSNYPSNMAEEQFPFLKGGLEKDSNGEAIRSHIKSVTHEHALQHSVDMFKRAWVQGQLKAQRSETPGAINIIGFYDMHGTNGRYRVEVYGRFLPGENALIGPPQITRGHILADTAIPKNNRNTISGSDASKTAPNETKSHLPDAVQAADQKSRPRQAEEPSKSDNVPQSPEKPPSQEKETEKKAKE